MDGCVSSGDASAAVASVRRMRWCFSGVGERRRGCVLLIPLVCVHLAFAIGGAILRHAVSLVWGLMVTAQMINSSLVWLWLSSKVFKSHFKRVTDKQTPHLAGLDDWLLQFTKGRIRSVCLWVIHQEQ